MLGSRYGIAVFDEIDAGEFNPNISTELGFMYRQRKKCLLIKDKKIPKMFADISGKNYEPFDTYEIEKEIRRLFRRWMTDLGFEPPKGKIKL